jgi:hypothetical protein
MRELYAYRWRKLQEAAQWTERLGVCPWPGASQIPSVTSGKAPMVSLPLRAAGQLNVQSLRDEYRIEVIERGT